MTNDERMTKSEGTRMRMRQTERRTSNIELPTLNGQIEVVKRRRVLIALAVVFVVAVFVTVLWPEEREPEYQGKKLSKWLKIYATYSEDDPRHDQAADAVRHIGTNCIPYFSRWIRGHPWKVNVLFKVPGRWPPGVVGLLMGTDTERSNSATVGFEILGHEASSAVPALAALATNSTYPLTSYHAMCALMHIGGEGLGRVLTVVTNGSAPASLRFAAINVFRFETG